MNKKNIWSGVVPNGTVSGKKGAKALPQKINMHFLDKPIVQKSLGSNKFNKSKKV